MATFAVERILEFNTTIQGVFKLVRDKRCLLDKFIKDIEGTNLEPELSTLYQIMEDIANGRQHPKCRKLHLEKGIHGYEAKSKHLRLYFFHENNTGQIIVLGGKKKTQDLDISKFTKVLKEFKQSRK
jgi:hypothetical protein